MRIVYVDVLFMTNLAVNYLLLVLTAQLSGVYAGRLRLLAAGALGGLFAVFLYFPQLPLWGALCAKAALCAAVTMVAFHREPPAVAWRVSLVFVAVSFALAGGIMAVCLMLDPQGVGMSNGVPYVDLSLRLLLCATIGVYALLGLVFGRGGMSVKKKTIDLVITYGGSRVHLKGLADTGNLLADPVSGKRVIVVPPSVAARLLPQGAWRLIDQSAGAIEALEALADGWPGAFSLTPCKTATSGGMMITLRPDSVWLDGKAEKGYLIGLSSQEINTQGGCRAVIGV